MSKSEEQQAVLIHLDGTSLPDSVYEQYDLSTLEDQVIGVLNEQQVGEYDGNEIGPSGATIYLYGPNAEAILNAIQPVLSAYPLCRNAQIVVRQGGPGAPNRQFYLPT